MSTPSATRPLFLILMLVVLLGNAVAQPTFANEAAQIYAPLVLAPLTVTTAEDELNSDGDCSLREAILAANTDTPVDGCMVGVGREVILVPPGIYTLDLSGAAEDGNLSGDLDIRDELVLIGAGATATILRGSGDRVLHVLTDTHASVSQVTVAYGRTPDGAASSQADQPGEDAAPGGGIANHGFLTLTHSLVMTNSTGSGGAGFEETITQTATAGGSGGPGGALFNAGTAYVRNCYFANNTTGSGGDNPVGAAGGEGGAGGAIYNVGALWITATTVTNNRTGAAMPSIVPPFFHGGNGADGGGIANEGALVIERSTLAFNFTASGGSTGGGSHSAGGSGGDGGGIFSRGLLTIRNSTVSNNGTGGGGSANARGGNGGNGGGLANLGELRLSQSTVAANYVGSGGSGLFGEGQPGLGGGIFNQGTVEILSSIAAMNTNPVPEGGVDCSGVLTSFGYNLVETTTGCTLAGVLTGNLVDVPAGLATLGDNGGGMLTHALLPTGPAIDAGLCTDLAGQPVLIDQRGVARPQGPACDMGAFEAAISWP
ncbi:MAG: CSLREA domain-containing protein [Caldilineaceae bacterium]|nr:CSLREA domain-containing protein [Caldilineaceae bacterium]